MSSIPVNENEEIRDAALKASVKIYKRGTEAVRKVVEKHALLYLGFMSLAQPPPELRDPRDPRDPRGPRVWTDELYHVCLTLVMALLAENEGQCAYGVL